MVLGTPITDANVVSYQLCPGYGPDGHDLLTWTTTNESGGDFEVLDLTTNAITILPYNCLEAYPIVPASNGNIYVGTSDGSIWRYEPKTGGWSVLARPFTTDSNRPLHHVRCMCEGPGGWLYYGSCYGERGRVNICTGQVETLPAIPESGTWYCASCVALPDGRIAFGMGYVARIFIYDPVQGKDVAQWAPPSWQQDGFILTMEVAQNVLYANHFPSGLRGAFDITTGQYLGSAPWGPMAVEPQGSPWEHQGIDYFILPGTDTIATCDGQQVLEWNPITDPQGSAIPLASFSPTGLLAEEMEYAVTGDLKVIKYDATRQNVIQETEYAQPTADRELWGLGIGPDGCIYGGAYQSTELFRYNPTNGKLTDLGNQDPGWSGETYSFCTLGDDLVCASYINGAITMYDPSQPWQCNYLSQVNPHFVGCFGQNTYRPYACTVTSDGRIWGVGEAGWGTTGGGISWIDPATGQTGTTALADIPWMISEVSPSTLVMASADQVYWWNEKTNSQLGSCAFPNGSTADSVLLQGGAVPEIAFCDSQGLHVATLPTPGALQVQRTYSCPIDCLKMLCEGDQILVGGSNGIAQLDLRTGKWTMLSSFGPSSRFAFVATADEVYFTQGSKLLEVLRPPES